MDPKPKQEEKPKTKNPKKIQKVRFRVLNDTGASEQEKSQDSSNVYCTRFDGG